MGIYIFTIGMLLTIPMALAQFTTPVVDASTEMSMNAQDSNVTSQAPAILNNTNTTESTQGAHSKQAVNTTVYKSDYSTQYYITPSSSLSSVYTSFLHSVEIVQNHTDINNNSSFTNPETTRAFNFSPSISVIPTVTQQLQGTLLETVSVSISAQDIGMFFLSASSPDTESVISTSPHLNDSTFESALLSHIPGTSTTANDQVSSLHSTWLETGDISDIYQTSVHSDLTKIQSTENLNLVLDSTMLMNYSISSRTISQDNPDFLSTIYQSDIHYSLHMENISNSHLDEMSVIINASSEVIQPSFTHTSLSASSTFDMFSSPHVSNIYQTQPIEWNATSYETELLTTSLDSSPIMTSHIDLNEHSINVSAISSISMSPTFQLLTESLASNLYTSLSDSPMAYINATMETIIPSNSMLYDGSSYFVPINSDLSTIAPTITEEFTQDLSAVYPTYVSETILSSQIDGFLATIPMDQSSTSNNMTSYPVSMTLASLYSTLTPSLTSDYIHELIITTPLASSSGSVHPIHTSIASIEPTESFGVTIESSHGLENVTEMADNFTHTTDAISTTSPPRVKSTTEWVLNKSEAYDNYWVKTILKVPLAVDAGGITFRKEMETQFATILDEALIRLEQILNGEYKPLRRKKRAVTMGNATVQMITINRADPEELSHTTLIYYLIEEDPDNNMTAADRTVGLIELFSDQELAIKLGYEVVLKAETVVPIPPPPKKKLWIIGAVIGGIAGLVMLIWLILFIYFKCTRPPRKSGTPRSPRSGKVADLDSMDYRNSKDNIKGFDYVRTEVGIENELDRQNVPDYYRRYPMGSSDLEGMYSPEESPPPPFKGHRPVSLQGSTEKPPREGNNIPPAPPIEGLIPLAQPETKSKPSGKASLRGSKKKSKQRISVEKSRDDLPSTEPDSDTTQHNSSQGSEDKKPLSKSGRQRSNKHKKGLGNTAGTFENVSKMGHIEEVENVDQPIRSTVHAIKIPPVDQQQKADHGAEDSPRDVEEVLRQKADLERWRNKQRLREKKSGERKHAKHPVGEDGADPRAYKQHQGAAPAPHPGRQSDRPKKKKKRPRDRPPSTQPQNENIELQPVNTQENYRAIRPVVPSMVQSQPLGQLESASSDEDLMGLDDDTRQAKQDKDKARQLVNALLDEAFAMVTPTPASRTPVDHQPPVDQFQPPYRGVSATPVVESGPQHTPLYITPVHGHPQPPSSTWNPYTAGDISAHIIPKGSTPLLTPHAPRVMARQPDRTPPLPPHHVHHSHQYTNPAYTADPVQIGTKAIPRTPLNNHTEPPYREYSANNHWENPITNGYSADEDTSKSAFRPYQQPNWTDSIPRAWSDADSTLPIGRKSSSGLGVDYGIDIADESSPRTRPDPHDFSRYHVPRPERRDHADDEIDIVSDAMKSGSATNPLIASIREEIQRLAQRSQENNAVNMPTS